MKNNINLDNDQKKALLDKLKCYVSEELDRDIGDLKAELFFDFLGQNFGKAWYNRGVMDCRKFFRQRMEDLEVDLDQLYL
ncbi:MAG: DUF2164 domain-containing protein [Spirochaetales bacterium]|nr:DUF2164 domain-containing protein [Spirochaetales bacterium]